MRVDYPEPAVGSTVMGASRATPSPADGEIAHAFESALYGMRCAQLVVEAFLSYNASFREITRRAIERFADRDWHGSQRDAVERIELYERWMQATVVELEGALGENARSRTLWSEVKRHFTNLTEGLPDNEFCKTFFSSVTRQLFGTVGVSPDIEFVATDLNPLAAAKSTQRVTRRYAMSGDLTLLIKKLLESQPLRAPWADLDASAWVVASALERMLWQRGELRHIESLEVIDAVFYQSTRAYLVGRMVGRRMSTPIAIALRNTEAGVVVDATMLPEDEISILFGFARSYFHVDLEHVAATVSFLRELLPKKPAGELFTVLGRAKQGKTERYRSLFRHLSTSDDRFVPAPGQRGLVMICFTLPSFDVVFKVIRDHIAEVKSVSKKDVMAKVQLRVPARPRRQTHRCAGVSSPALPGGSICRRATGRTAHRGRRQCPPGGQRSHLRSPLHRKTRDTAGYFPARRAGGGRSARGGGLRPRDPRPGLYRRISRRPAAEEFRRHAPWPRGVL
jgi:isocitrate dehydrogenase kinase/phosphatase